MSNPPHGFLKPRLSSPFALSLSLSHTTHLLSSPHSFSSIITIDVLPKLSVALAVGTRSSSVIILVRRTNSALISAPRTTHPTSLHSSSSTLHLCICESRQLQASFQLAQSGEFSFFGKPKHSATPVSVSVAGTAPQRKFDSTRHSTVRVNAQGLFRNRKFTSFPHTIQYSFTFAVFEQHCQQQQHIRFYSTPRCLPKTS